MALRDKIELGMSLPHRSLDPIEVEAVRRVAQRAEALGFRELWVPNNTLDRRASCLVGGDNYLGRSDKIVDAGQLAYLLAHDAQPSNTARRASARIHAAGDQSLESTRAHWGSLGISTICSAQGMRSSARSSAGLPRTHQRRATWQHRHLARPVTIY